MFVRKWLIAVGTVCMVGLSYNTFAGCCYRENGNKCEPAAAPAACTISNGTYTDSSCCSLSPTVSACGTYCPDASLSPGERGLIDLLGDSYPLAGGVELWFMEAPATGGLR